MRTHYTIKHYFLTDHSTDIAAAYNAVQNGQPIAFVTFIFQGIHEYDQCTAYIDDKLKLHSYVPVCPPKREYMLARAAELFEIAGTQDLRDQLNELLPRLIAVKAEAKTKRGVAALGV